MIPRQLIKGWGNFLLSFPYFSCRYSGLQTPFRHLSIFALFFSITFLLLLFLHCMMPRVLSVHFPLSHCNEYTIVWKSIKHSHKCFSLLLNDLMILSQGVVKSLLKEPYIFNKTFSYNSYLISEKCTIISPMKKI